MTAPEHCWAGALRALRHPCPPPPGLGFALFTVMVVADFLNWPKALEEGVKVVAGTVIFLGFLAARLQLAQPGAASPPTLTPAGRFR